MNNGLFENGINGHSQCCPGSAKSSGSQIVKTQVQPKPAKAMAAGSAPRQNLAGLQVFSKAEEIQGAVVRHPFRLGSRKGRFFQGFHVGLLMLLLVFIGRDELRAQPIPMERTDLPPAWLVMGKDMPGGLLDARPRHFLPCGTPLKWRDSAHPAAVRTAWQSNC